MNVGQIWECELWLAGYLLKMHYGIAPFDEREEPEAQRNTQERRARGLEKPKREEPEAQRNPTSVFLIWISEASKQTNNPWFNPTIWEKHNSFM